MSLRFAQTALLGSMVVVAAPTPTPPPKPMPVIEQVAAIAASPADVPYTDTLRYPSPRTKPAPGHHSRMRPAPVLSRANVLKFNKQA